MGREYADHGIPTVLVAYGLANDGGISRKALLPEEVAQNHDVGRAGLILLGLKSSSQRGLNAEQIAEIRSHSQSANQVWRAVARKIKVSLASKGNLFETSAVLPPEFEFFRSHRPLKPFASRFVLIEPDQAIRIAVGQWSQQDPVDDAEDGGVRSDTERERENSHGAESGVLQQLPEGEPEFIHNEAPPRDSFEPL